MIKKITCRYFLFDYDGTICNTLPTMNFALAQTFAAYQVKVPDERERLKAISAGLTLHDTIRLLHPDAAQLNEPEVDAMIKTYRQLYLDADEQLTVLFDGTRAVFNHLNRLGKKIVVLSNKGIAAVERSLQFHGLFNLADMIVAEGILPELKLKAKPDPMMYEAVISRQFNITNNQEVLMTGDTHADILFAKNCGLTSCWAAYGYGKRSACEALLPDYTIQQISELLEMVKE
jgi:phosphoglycolate phosphatase-like HAD superfamily hydrolase